MANVSAGLTVVSNDITTSSNIKVGVTNSLTVTHGGIIRSALTSTAKGTAAGQVTLITSGDWAPIPYLYVKNLDTTTTDYVYIYADTSSDDQIVAQLAGGDFCWIPCKEDVTLKAFAQTSGTNIEYGVFGTEA